MRSAVIGGGIIGCAVARELARRGVGVDLFERRTVAGGATQASAGALVPFVEAHDPGPLQDLSVRSLGMYEEFVSSVQRDSGRDVGFGRPGSIEIAFSEEEAAALHRLAEALGPRHGQWVGEDELQNLQPGVSDEAVGGLFVPQHAHVSAAALTQALALAARRAGARLHAADVTAIRLQDDGVIVDDSTGPSQRFDRVVVAAGSWVTKLGLPGLVPVRPVKGQLLRVRVSAPTVSRILWSARCYVVPQAGGEVLIGATMEDVGFDESPTDAAAAVLLQAFAGVMPQADLVRIDHRVGLRPATPDSLPIVGHASASSRLVYAVGHFRNGIILAPLTAHLVAGVVAEDLEDPALALLAPARFGL